MGWARPAWLAGPAGWAGWQGWGLLPPWRHGRLAQRPALQPRLVPAPARTQHRRRPSLLVTRTCTCTRTRPRWWMQERLKQYTKKVRKAAAEKELSESRRSLEVGWLAGRASWLAGRGECRRPAPLRFALALTHCCLVLTIPPPPCPAVRPCPHR